MRGGIERYIADLCTHQAGSGHSPEVLAVEEPAGEMIPAAAWHIAPSEAHFASAPLSRAYIGMYRDLARSVDVVHYHGPNPIAELAALITPRGTAGHVATFHADVSKEKPFFRLYRPFAHRYLRRMDRIIAASEVLTRTSPLLSRWQSEVQVIPFGVNAGKFSAPTRSSTHPTQIVFVGRLVHYKGIDVLLEALPLVPQARLDVIGTGPLGPALEARATSLGVADRVRFLGRIPDEDLVARYASAEVLVLPSITRGEAFGYVLLEAMAAGCAIVSTELGSATSWINQDGITGRVVPPADAPALGQALSWLLADPARLRTVQAAAVQRAKDFSLAHMFRETDRVYREARALGASRRQSAGALR